MMPSLATPPHTDRELVARLRELAKAATPGEWVAHHQPADMVAGDCDWSLQTDRDGAFLLFCHTPGAPEKANAAYIAAANPAAITELCDDRDAWKARAEAAERELYTGSVDPDTNERETWRQKAASTLGVLLVAKRRAEAAEQRLADIAALEPSPIGDTGFFVGPQALLDQAQRIAREGKRGPREPSSTSTRLHHDHPHIAGASGAPPVVEFAKWVLLEMWRGGDVDGGDIQEKAAALGLIVETTYDPEKHGEDGNDFDTPGPGDTWFVFAGPLLATAPAPPPTSPEPVAWRYQLAYVRNTDTEEYTDWRWKLSEDKPHVPDGSIRHLTPLYAAAPAPPVPEWYYDYLRHEIKQHGGVIDPEDGSVTWRPAPEGLELSEADKLTVARLGHYREDHTGKMVLTNPDGPAAADLIARLQAALAEAEARLNEFDVCMCGSRMSDHSIGSGHAPMSMYDYQLEQWKKEAEEAKAALAGAKRAGIEEAREAAWRAWTASPDVGATGGLMYDAITALIPEPVRGWRRP